MSGAALGPGRGYPPYPFVGDDPAGACDVGEARGAPGGRLVTGRGVLEYLPALRDGVTVGSPPARRCGSALAAAAARSASISAGTMQEGLHPNVGATLEAVEAARRAEVIEAEQLALRRAEWSQGCGSGDREICESLREVLPMSQTRMPPRPPLTRGEWIA